MIFARTKPVVQMETFNQSIESWLGFPVAGRQLEARRRCCGPATFETKKLCVRDLLWDLMR
jgi:hypothetical protein